MHDLVWSFFICPSPRCRVFLPQRLISAIPHHPAAIFSVVSARSCPSCWFSLHGPDRRAVRRDLPRCCWSCFCALLTGFVRSRRRRPAFVARVLRCCSLIANLIASPARRQWSPTSASWLFRFVPVLVFAATWVAPPSFPPCDRSAFQLVRGPESRSSRCSAAHGFSSHWRQWTSGPSFAHWLQS